MTTISFGLNPQSPKRLDYCKTTPALIEARENRIKAYEEYQCEERMLRVFDNDTKKAVSKAFYNILETDENGKVLDTPLNRHLRDMYRTGKEIDIESLADYLHDRPLGVIRQRVRPLLHKLSEQHSALDDENFSGGTKANFSFTDFCRERVRIVADIIQERADKKTQKSVIDNYLEADKKVVYLEKLEEYMPSKILSNEHSKKTIAAVKEATGLSDMGARLLITMKTAIKK